MISVTIDGKQIEVDSGTTILDAARKTGAAIPTLCHSELVRTSGACKVCSVEAEEEGGKRRVITSCKYPIKKPMQVWTRSEAAVAARRKVLTEMLSRWPNVGIVGELARAEGIDQPAGVHPLRNESEHACILCGLCIRLCKEALWHDILKFEGAFDQRRVVMKSDVAEVDCNGCGACEAICPAGAITMVDDPNHPADPERIRRAGMAITREVVLYDKQQCLMREIGTAHLNEVMNDYDLLPVHNYKFGSHKDIGGIHSQKFKAKFTQGVFDGCALGCDMACAKAVEGFELKTGPDKGKKVVVDGPEYETVGGCGSNMGVFDTDWIIELNYYCDDYGVDTISFGTCMAFVMECYEAGILNMERTGGLALPFGAAEAALEVLHQMARGEGFGLIVGQGVRKMKKIFAERFGGDPAFLKDIGMENKGLEFSQYMSKESLAQQGGYCMTNKGPQHDEAWLIFMDMVNKQLPTFEAKAEALHYFPVWRTWFGLQGLCKLPWNDVEPEDNAQEKEPAKVPKHVRGYCELFAGMTGKEVTVHDLLKQSERVYNFQRLFNLKMGFGTREHDAIPYRGVGPVTEEEYLSRQERYDGQLKEILGLDPGSMSLAEKRATLRKHREQQYEKLLDAVYLRRGWNQNGIPKRSHVKKLRIDQVPGVLELLSQHGITD